MMRPTFVLAVIVTLLRLDPTNANWGWQSRFCQCDCSTDSTDQCINFNDLQRTRERRCSTRTCQANCNLVNGVNGRCVTRDCIAADSVLFSCKSQSYVTADSIVPGDHIRTLSSKDGSSVCSEVFYTFAHKGASHAFEVELEDSSKVTVSDSHLLYVGSSFESRKAQMAKNIQIGDMLVSSDGSAKKVISIKDTASELVNVLTMEGSIELGNGVVISTHSFHETLYSAVFYPIKLAYEWIGAPAVKKAEPYLLEVEALFKPYFAMIVDSM